MLSPDSPPVVPLDPSLLGSGPADLSAGGAGIIVRRDVLRFSGELDPAGALLVLLGTPPMGASWQVDRVAARAAAGAPALDLYIGSVGLAGWVSGTAAADRAEAEFPSGLVVPSGQQLLAEWTVGVPASAVAIVVQVAEVR